MRRIGKHSLLMTALLSLALLPGDARVINDDVGRLASDAEVIVAAQVTEIQTVGATFVDDYGKKIPTTICEAQLKVDHFLKGGDGEAQFTLRFIHPSWPLIYDIPRVKAYRIFFLKRLGKAVEFVRPEFSSIIAVPGVLPQGETTMDRILHEMAAVLQAPTASVSDKRNAIWILFRSNGPIAAKAIADATRDPNPEVRLSAVSGLLLMKDNSQIEAGVQALLQPPPGVSMEVVHSIAYAIGASVDDPKTIPLLLKVQSSADPIMRRTATNALGRTRDPAVIPALARALDDPDSDTRHTAVRWLSIMTNDDLRPNQEEFRASEERYLNHFRALVKNMKNH